MRNCKEQLQGHLELEITIYRYIFSLLSNCTTTNNSSCPGNANHRVELCLVDMCLHNLSWLIEANLRKTCHPMTSLHPCMLICKLPYTKVCCRFRRLDSQITWNTLELSSAVIMAICHTQPSCKCSLKYT